ncbi:MAG: hypothetical protein BWX50_01469 [Euryarchaeota archaeon ADurb.Bin009]|nr:MAG: hypothetical protein BWX50_01469 [Euryarchaeota archaeon ADurb.Bin009]
MHVHRRHRYEPAILCHDEVLDPPFHLLEQRVVPAAGARPLPEDCNVHGPVADEGADGVDEARRDHLAGLPRSLDGAAVPPDQLDDAVLGEDVVVRTLLALPGKDGLFGVPIPGEDPAPESPGKQAPLPGVEVLGAAEDGPHGRERFDLVLAHVAGEHHGRRGVGLDEPGAKPADPVDVGGQGLLGHVVGRHDQPPAEERLLPVDVVSRGTDDITAEDDAAVGEPVADAVPLGLHERPLLCPGGAPLVVEPDGDAGGAAGGDVFERRPRIIPGF